MLWQLKPLKRTATGSKRYEIFQLRAPLCFHLIQLTRSHRIPIQIRWSVSTLVGMARKTLALAGTRHSADCRHLHDNDRVEEPLSAQQLAGKYKNNSFGLVEHLVCFKLEILQWHYQWNTRMHKQHAKIRPQLAVSDVRWIGLQSRVHLKCTYVSPSFGAVACAARELRYNIGGTANT